MGGGERRDLLDRYWAHHIEADDLTPLMDSQLDRIEGWLRSSEEHTSAAAATDLAFVAQARALLPGAGDLAPSLRTAADAAQLAGVARGVNVELTAPHPEMGLHAVLFWAANNYPLRTAEHGERFVEKLHRFPAAMDELCERLRSAAAAGRAPLARHSARQVERLTDHLDSPLDDDPLLAQPAPAEVDAEVAAAWRARVRDAVAGQVRPALDRYRATLRDDSLPAGRADDACGLLHHPDGERTYADLVEAYTTEGMTPERVHDLGLEQVARLAEEYRTLGAQVLGTGNLAEVFTRLRDEDLHFRTAADVVAAAKRHHARAEEIAPDWFLRTPVAGCDVRATDHGAVAFYARPAEDGSRPGVFFFNTSDPTIWGPNLAATVFHEGIPGHHFQLALAQEDRSLHDLHRELYLPAFGEGWALYTERLADQMGLYEHGLDRLGMLINDSMRACRLVVDTGMHALGWSRQRAIEFMLDNSPMRRVEVEAEVDRYIAMPGQATSYMVGRLEIERLRDAARTRLGPRFDLAAFHDRVLSRGTVSLPALARIIDTWEGP